MPASALAVAHGVRTRPAIEHIITAGAPQDVIAAGTLKHQPDFDFNRSARD